jgi:hypothetical protein
MSIVETETSRLVELVEATLDDARFSWKRRDSGWVIPANARLPREIQMREDEAGVAIEATLAEWEEISPIQIAALALLCAEVQRRLPIARCEIGDRRFRMAAQVAHESLERELAQGLGEIAGGVSLLAQEVEALLDPNIAKAYWTFMQSAGSPEADSGIAGRMEN